MANICRQIKKKKKKTGLERMKDNFFLEEELEATEINVENTMSRTCEK